MNERKVRMVKPGFIRVGELLINLNIVTSIIVDTKYREWVELSFFNSEPMEITCNTSFCGGKYSKYVRKELLEALIDFLFDGEYTITLLAKVTLNEEAQNDRP